MYSKICEGECGIDYPFGGCTGIFLYLTLQYANYLSQTLCLMLPMSAVFFQPISEFSVTCAAMLSSSWATFSTDNHHFEFSGHYLELPSTQVAGLIVRSAGLSM